MTPDLRLRIGPLGLSLAGVPWTPATIPANFRPFLDAADDPDAAQLAVDCSGCLQAIPADAPLSSSCNDLGRAELFRAADGRSWLVALTPAPGHPARVMIIDPSLASARLWLLSPSDPWADFVIDSMSRIFFSQFAASRGALMLHASAVACSGRAFLFMGRSGTGKSTHSRLWLSEFPGSQLINDDCPLVAPAASGCGFNVCGTPWSGKTPCWRRVSVALAGVARLRQAPANRFIPTSGVDSFVAFIPGMSVITSDRALYAAASSTALNLLDSVAAGILECLPDRQAALLCRQSLDRTHSSITVSNK